MKKSRILLIDDDATFSQLIVELLKDEFDVHRACCVQEAEEFLKSSHVDLILTDLIMPDATGLDFLRDFDTEIPIIVMSGQADVDTALDCLKNGAVDLLEKPIGRDPLLASIRRSLITPHTVCENTMLETITDGFVRSNSIAGFKIIRILGEGNMGIVYQVTGSNVGGKQKEYALKVMKPMIFNGGDHKVLMFERFEAEARAAFSIHNPNIVHIYDYGITEANRPYILMEYVQGQTLDKLIDMNELRIRDKCHILRQVAFGLASIHDNDICHRDIKPSNVIVSPGLEAKLTDFGIARLKDSTLTHTNEIFGTPSFLSPEAFITAKVDFRSDIFSLGCLAYELFTSVRPFDGPSIVAVAREIQESNPDLISMYDSDFPRELDKMVMKMLSKKPEDRHKSAFEIFEILTNYLKGASTKSFISRLKNRIGI
ncbi:MAG: protein kinase [Lentisphaeria bacterium]|nr:protein kinase [Lentisphaeria bacterium]NQZ68961.1 protein kinase [Lentisphaeria bacterium]